MKYSVTYYNEFYDQCYKNIAANEDDITTFPVRKSTDVVVGETKEQCIEFVKDFLDSPEKPLTLEEVKNDFGMDISDANAEKVMRFYNGRYEVFQVFLKEFSDKLKLNEKTSIHFRYDLPEEMNTFSFEDDEHYQLNAYIEIDVEK